MGIHSITDEYRMALFVDGADLSADTIRYNNQMEASGYGYEAGGIVIPNMRVDTDEDGSYIDFDSVVYNRLTVAVDGCLIYNASKENRAVAVFNFGETLTARNGKIEVESPRGIVRLK
jgi:hypothetical protein